MPLAVALQYHHAALILEGIPTKWLNEDENKRRELMDRLHHITH